MQVSSPEYDHGLRRDVRIIRRVLGLVRRARTVIWLFMDLFPPYGLTSARFTIYLRRGRIRRVRIDYGKVSVVRRLIKRV